MIETVNLTVVSKDDNDLKAEYRAECDTREDLGKMILSSSMLRSTAEPHYARSGYDRGQRSDGFFA